MKLRNLQRTLVALTVMLCSWLPSLAQEFDMGIFRYNILSEEDYTVEISDVLDKTCVSVKVSPMVKYDGVNYSVVAIGKHAFYECSMLKTVELCSTIKTIDYAAFGYCESLTSIDIPKAVKTIGEYAFYNCTKLASVTLGSSVKTIGTQAFYGCESLTSIDIPDSVKTIGDYAFYDCSALNMVEFGASVESIGEEAFLGCYELREVYSRATTPPVCTGIFEQETVMGTLFVPTGCKSVYAETFPWNAFWTIEELDSLGVEGVAADEVEVKAAGGSIVFGGATEANIYSSAGILVASGEMSEVEVPAGLYIVVAGGKSHKIIVK